MSTLRKHVLQSIEVDMPIPKKSNEHLAKVMDLRGDNVMQVEMDNGSLTLVLLPKKFHKLIWISRGDYVLVELTDRKKEYLERKLSKKVFGTIEFIYTAKRIKHLKEALKKGEEQKRWIWGQLENEDNEEEEEEEEEELIGVVNPNRVNYDSESDSETETESDDEEE
mmetsp:Transcript_4234/g.6238  ORF Transcript_4234/g.6238 Transcript_4234/m.6238 type:complete len:167 (-) Transcript_4234:1495-1995(-)